MWQVQYEGIIESSVEEVWRVLTDLPRYPEWNLYSREAHGDLRVGGIVTIVVQLGSEQQRVANKVLEIIPNQRLCWQSQNWYRFLVSGKRCRFLQAQPDGTTVFRQEEFMTGIIAPFIKRIYEPRIIQGIQIECESLKAEVERRSA